MSSQMQTDLNCLIGRCLLASINPNRTEKLDRLLVVIRAYGQGFGGFDEEIDKAINDDIEIEKLFPDNLTFLVKWFELGRINGSIDDEIRECLTLECSRFSASANQENLELNIKKCINKVHEMKKSPLSTNDKLLKYIALKEKTLKALIEEREEEIKNLKKLVV